MYGNFGFVFYSFGDYNKVIDYYKLDFKIVKEVGDKVREVFVYDGLGVSFELFGCLFEVLDYY